jgi:hypothetical protein
MKNVNSKLFSGLTELKLSDKSMTMISGGVTTNDCTGSGSTTDCGDWNSAGDGYNNDNVVTSPEFDSKQSS